MARGKKKVAVALAVMLASSSLAEAALADLSGSVGITSQYQANLLSGEEGRLTISGNYHLGVNGVLLIPRLGNYLLSGTFSRLHYDSGDDTQLYPALKAYDYMLNLFPQGKLQISMGGHKDESGLAGQGLEINPGGTVIQTSYARINTILPFRVGMNYLYTSSRELGHGQPYTTQETQVVSDKTKELHTVDLSRFFPLGQAGLDTNTEVNYQEVTDHLQGDLVREGYTGRFQAKMNFFTRPLFLSVVDTTVGYVDPGWAAITTNEVTPGLSAGVHSRWSFSDNLWLDETVSYQETGGKWTTLSDLGFIVDRGESFRMNGNSAYSWSREEGKRDTRKWNINTVAISNRWPQFPLNMGAQIREGYDTTRQMYTRTYGAVLGSTVRQNGFTLAPSCQWQQTVAFGGGVLADSSLGSLGVGYSQELGNSWLSANTGLVLDKSGLHPQSNYDVQWRYRPGNRAMLSVNYTGRIPGGEDTLLADSNGETTGDTTSRGAHPSVGVTLQYWPWNNLDVLASYTAFEETPGGTGSTGPLLRQYNGQVRYVRRNLSLTLWGERKELVGGEFKDSLRVAGVYQFRAVTFNLNASWVAPGAVGVSLSLTRSF